MRRTLHSFVGMVFGLVVAALALSGAVLALYPVGDRLGAVDHAPGLTVADLAARVVAANPGVEEIRRTEGGRFVAAVSGDDGPANVTVDPATGAALARYEISPLRVWVEDLHRAFLTGDRTAGHVVSGLGAVAMVVVLLSGSALLHARMGGWRRIRARVKGAARQRWHILVARVALPGLALAAATGVVLSLGTFALVPVGLDDRADFPDAVDGGEPAAPESLAALRQIRADDLRRLVFPFDGDPEEPFEIVTRTGEGFVDQATGARLTWVDYARPRMLHDWIVALHSGRGLWWLAPILGLSALCVPWLAATGTAIWWQRRRARPRIRRNVALADADTVILVGSEGNTTWGFALTLQDALSQAGHFVHVAEMNALAPMHTGDRRLFVLTATYGDGAAPATASHFLDRLAKVATPPARGFTVLGFGDREFDLYCNYALEVEAAMVGRGWTRFAPMGTINRQSPQEFARWGEQIGGLLGIDLRLVHIVETPRGTPLRLIAREDYGQDIGAPTAILRFALGGDKGRRALPRYESGDLLGVVPPGSTMPRYYSLGSSSADGFLEIAVRRHENGLCSGYLHDLVVGDEVRGFVRPNPEFNLVPGKTPVILVGAGCGIGPLAGFIRANRSRRPMRLYFGARDPKSDFLYQHELREWLAEGRLSALITAFSRADERMYLQHRMHEDAEVLRKMIRAGAQVMIVGSREMAQGVAGAMEEILRPAGTGVAALRAEGRYVEDIF